MVLRNRVAGCRRAVAAMEFGILAPVMAIIVLAVVDIAKVAILWEQVWRAARSIGESATTLAIPTTPGATNHLTLAQANEAMSAIFAEIPWVAAGIATGMYTGTGQNPPNTITVVMSSVDYYPTVAGCTHDCTYQNTVEWSKAYAGSATTTGFKTGNVLRPCGVGQFHPASLLTGLRYATNNLYVPDPFLVVDVRIKVTPWVFSAITGSFTLSATSYVPVRVSQAQPTDPNNPDDYITLDDSNDPNTCFAPAGT